MIWSTEGASFNSGVSQSWIFSIYKIHSTFFKSRWNSKGKRNQSETSLSHGFFNNRWNNYEILLSVLNHGETVRGKQSSTPEAKPRPVWLSTTSQYSIGLAMHQNSNLNYMHMWNPTPNFLFLFCPSFHESAAALSHKFPNSKIFGRVNFSKPAWSSRSGQQRKLSIPHHRMTSLLHRRDG